MSRSKRGADRHPRGEVWMTVLPATGGAAAEREVWQMILWVTVGHLDARVALALVGARATLATASAALGRARSRR